MAPQAPPTTVATSTEAWLTAITSSSTSTSTSSATSPPTTGGVSSSLYLFTFLITIVVLALISAGLLLRACYVRRQFQRRVEEAIAAGRPLPQDAAAALGLIRPKKSKEVGPMPRFWEAGMEKSEKSEVNGNEGSWDEIKPLAIVHFPTHDAPPPPADLSNLPPQTRGPSLLRLLLPSGMRPHPEIGASRPGLTRYATNTSTQEAGPAFTVPEEGESVSVGVMIALPVEGKDRQKWEPEEDEESEVPQVCLGVLETKVGH